MKINVLIDKEYKARLRAAWLRRLATQVLKAEKASPNAEMGLVITGQERIRELNRTYRHLDRPTDVLSFSLTEGEPFAATPDGAVQLGEVIISYPQAQIQAGEREHPVEQEITLLLIHGVLHLLGYDHEKAAEGKRMRAREADLLLLVRGKGMKVLGIAGSPRRGGNTDLLLAEVLKGAASKGAEVKTIVLNNLCITPCQHCDACLVKGRCRIQDDMQDIYKEMEEADCIVLASPIQFMGVTAQLKAMIDRCQALWARKYVLKVPPLGDRRTRKGFFIAVGGRKFEDLFDGALLTVKSFFHVLDIAYAGELLFRSIDEKGAITRHPDALKQAYEAGKKLVED